MADLEFANGGETERRRREYRGAEGAEEGGVWGGGIPIAPSPEKFSILSLKMATLIFFLGAILTVHCSFFHGVFKAF